MSIERLTFMGDEMAYSPLETSIHIARYQIAKEFASKKKVLDIACGEGYGSFLLKNWGAKSVVGVDISQESINNASKNFSSEDITFICSSAEEIAIEEKFDLIVSLETIEHIPDQIQYLRNLKSLLSEHGVLIISCPNDHWYYKENESNEFHLRKYTLVEFVKESESILGKAKAWYLGGNIFGYGNFQYDIESKKLLHSKDDLTMKDMLIQTETSSSLSLNKNEFLPTEEECLYYIGIWSNNSLNLNNHETYNAFPLAPIFISVEDFYSLKTWADELEEAIEILRKDNSTLKTYINELEVGIKDLKNNDDSRQIENELIHINNRNVGLEKKALELENELSKENIYKITSEKTMVEDALEKLKIDNQNLDLENIELRTVYNRYQKIKKIIPLPIRKLIVKSIKG